MGFQQSKKKVVKNLIDIHTMNNGPILINSTEHVLYFHFNINVFSFSFVLFKMRQLELVKIVQSKSVSHISGNS